MADLSPEMTLSEFENGYWYATEVRAFAVSLGVPGANKLRKDELETAIRTYLRTGKAETPTKRSLYKTGVKDLERGLTLDLPIQHYTSNRVTKDWLVSQAREMAPVLRERWGVWYRVEGLGERQS